MEHSCTSTGHVVNYHRILVLQPSKSSENDGIGADVKQLQVDLKMALDKLTSADLTKKQTDKDEIQRKVENFKCFVEGLS